MASFYYILILQPFPPKIGELYWLDSFPIFWTFGREKATYMWVAGKKTIQIKLVKLVRQV